MALKKMQRGKAADKYGLVVDLLKDSGATILTAIASIFNDILSKETMAPHKWKQSRIIVLFKKGDKHKPGNYITLLPIYTSCSAGW